MGKRCAFFGHREIGEDIEVLENKLRLLIETLIVKDNVDIFLFGSRSEFDNMCWQVVSEYKKIFSFIKRIAYDCIHEKSMLVDERIKFQKTYYNLYKKEIYLREFELVHSSEISYKAGKNAYIARNQEMIDNSDIIVFYYNESYEPKTKINKSIFNKPKSGTALAYKYALQKKIINLY